MCLSVCLSVTRLYCLETASHTIPVFPPQMLWQYSDEDLPNGSVECKGYEKIATFDQYLAYLGNDTKCGHSYYGL